MLAKPSALMVATIPWMLEKIVLQDYAVVSRNLRFNSVIRVTMSASTAAAISISSITSSRRVPFSIFPMKEIGRPSRLEKASWLNPEPSRSSRTSVRNTS